MATITSPRSASPAIPTITSPSLPSANGTPTSSVRASIDLPPGSGTHTPVTNVGNQNQRRNRAALRDYYNLKNKPSPAGSLPAGSTSNLSRSGSFTSTTSESTHVSSVRLTTDTIHAASALPNQLDDPTFDAEAYIANLLKTSSLKDILRTEGSLVSEIRNLDGEQKALVYDNYSKLIVAVSTIGEMQKGILDEGGRGTNRDGTNSGLAKMKSLEAKLDGLMAGFKEMSINPEKNSVDAERAQARRQNRELRRKRELVKWALDAPERIEGLVESGKRDQAEKQWTEVEKLLDKWGTIEGVDKVREGCQKALNQDKSNE